MFVVSEDKLLGAPQTWGAREFTLRLPPDNIASSALASHKNKFSGSSSTTQN